MSDDMRIVGEETVDDEVVVESVGEVDEGVLAVGRGHVNRETGEERLLVEVDFILQRESEKKMVCLKTNHTVRGQRIFLYISSTLLHIFTENSTSVSYGHSTDIFYSRTTDMWSNKAAVIKCICT